MVDRRDHLCALKEILLDERKLVTYVSLSKDMCIHVNESKFLLSEVIKELKEKNSDMQLNIKCIISGLLDSNKAQTVVCDETDLHTIKQNMKLVFYQHVYSVCIGSSSIDKVALMAINKFDEFPLCSGLIKNKLCVKRTSNEISNLRTNSQEATITESKSSISTLKKVKVDNTLHKTNTVSKQDVVENKLEQPIVKIETSSPKNEGVNNGIQKNERKTVSKPQKGIAGFFNKPSNHKKGATGVKENGSITHIKQEIKDLKNNIKSKIMDVDEGVITKENSASSKAEHKVAMPQIKTKSLDHIRKNAKVDKKRKRVLQVSDSESDDEKNDPFAKETEVDQNSDDEIPPTPLVETVKITSGILNPKKRRKIVNKTYTDEDGYLLTKKEEVYESCSENEEEVQVKENIQVANKVKVGVSPPENKNSVKNGKKKLTSPQKGKQATLMSFFKKV